MGNENILIKVDQNNLIHIDPNSVLNDGKISERNIKQEDLVIYVNLEANLVPRTTLKGNSDETINIASGVLKTIRNEEFNSSWTDTYVNNSKEDLSNQSFGISDITILNKGFNSIPQITINFIDVRGKTLFENPKDSPYKAFFHIPWPIYYLTIKGFYGKAVRYKLHLVKFNTKYNDTNGNFDVTTTFVGSTYAFMTDIPLKGIMNAPYLFGSENINTLKVVNGETKKIITKSSRGYNILKSVFNELKQKGLIDKDVPVKTLRELGKLSESLDNIIDRKEFGDIIDPKILTSIGELKNLFKKYDEFFIYWKEKNLTNSDSFLLGLRFKNNVETNKNLIFDNNTESLSSILTSFKEELNKTLSFDKTIKDGKINKISITKNFKTIDKYSGNPDENGYYVNFSLLMNDFNDIKNNFVNEQLRIEKSFEEELNNTNFYKNIFKFKPSLRNLFGIILANAEVLIRILKDTHDKAFTISDERKKIIGGYSNESVGDNIYPWPEIKKLDSKTNTNIISYPAENDLIVKLKSNSKKYWPEVSFIEEYLGVSTNVYDTNTEKENGVNDLNYNINNDEEFNYIPISQITSENIEKTYLIKTPKNILYELWERVYYTTILENFDKNILNIFIKNEINNITNSLKNDSTLIQEIKNIKSLDEFNKYLYKISQFDRFSYKKDLLPTTDYIKDSLNESFNLIFFNDEKNKGYEDNTIFNKELRKYTPKDYRKNIYPFNSTIYEKYIGENEYSDKQLKIYDNFEKTTRNGFLNTPIKPNSWVKSENITNIFETKDVNILNTSYFHYQLYKDFSYNQNYVGSSYLWLNSLPFLDLDNTISFNKTNNVLMSTLFKEVGAEHNIPYFLILKWGAIYHRYKTKLLTGKDILSNIINNDKIKEIDNNELFDNNQATNFIINNRTIKFSDKTELGIHPYYDSIFHQIINGYTHYNLSSPNTYNTNIQKGIIKTKTLVNNGLTLWTNIVNNKLINQSDDYLTILPSIGGNYEIHNNGYNNINNTDYRILLNNKNINNDTKNKKIPSYNEYHKSLTNETLLDLDYKKIYDLIATFNYKVLDSFEDLFIKFANGTTNKGLKYDSFKSVLKDLTTIKTTEITNEKLFDKIANLQYGNQLKITKTILSEEYLLKLNLFNPKEINPYIINQFVNKSTIFGNYNTTQLTQENINKIKLYIGECPNIINYYNEFFNFADIELNETNIKDFKTIILLYSGYKEINKNIKLDDFREYLKTNILNNKDFIYMMNVIINKFKDLEYVDILDENINIIDGHNNRDLKIELYNYFKSFNDKWIAGNSIGQTLLMEDFLFLDKANREIGDKVFLNISRFKDLFDEKNINLNLYSSLSLLLQGTGFDMRAMPSYLNFYNNNREGKTNNIANMLFGTFLEVDYQDTSPKIIIQYAGLSSTSLSDMSDNNKYFFNDDSFNMNDSHNHPLLITDTKNIDFNKSNRVVSFEVNIGDSNQNIFKSVSLDQSSFKNTTESHIVTENIARSNSGANSYNIDTALFEIYRTASYTCEVTCIGNVMIQPTMYFYLNNIPMFRGSYLITEVSHTIRNNNMVTIFKGVRIAKQALPDPNDSFMSSYKSLFDRIINKTVIKE